MGIRDQMALDLAAAFQDADGVAEPGKYNSSTDNISVIANEPQETIAFQDDGMLQKQEMRVYVLASEVASPKMGDKLNFRGADWFVKRALIGIAPGLNGLEIVSAKVTEKSMQGHRIER